MLRSVGAVLLKRNYFISLVCLLILAITGSDGLSAVKSKQTIRYDNYRVYQLEPKTPDQLNVLKELDGLRESYIFLDPIHLIEGKIHLLVSPQNVTSFEKLLKENNINDAARLEENAQLRLDDVAESVADPQRRDQMYTWQQYHELDDTYMWLRNLAKRYSQNVSTFEAGESYEGRTILGLKISYGSGRRAIFLEGGMHAREWISPATVTYITYQLITSSDQDVRKIAESYDWYIVPHTNPDGYVYTHKRDRLWRKTTKRYGNCFGADPNRNWGFHWNEGGSSNNPCSDTFAGPSAFSEIETRSLSNFLQTLKGNVILYISFHSYSQLLLYPFGYTGVLPPNNDNLERIFNVALAGMSRRYGTKYTGGNIYSAIYPASGSTVDWAYGVIDAKYPFCYELRPSLNNWSGFILSPNQIIPTGEETLDSLVAMVKEVSRIEGA